MSLPAQTSCVVSSLSLKRKYHYLRLHDHLDHEKLVASIICVIHADQFRNPTLSYTQRLEERIKELEDQLSKSQSQALSQAQQHASERPMSTSFDGAHHGHESGEGLTGTFRELKLDERGVLTYHGATSFFHLPSEYTGQEIDAPSSPLSEDPVNGRRERLVNNAWQQRALEDLSEIPVSNSSMISPCSPGPTRVEKALACAKR